MQSAVEYMSATGLRPEMIVTRLKEKLGGRLAHNVDSYEKIGTNRWSLAQVLDKEVQGLLDKGAIREVEPVPGQYVSSYFVVPKSKRSPDKWRPILNLKRFNRSVRHVYFQMEELKIVRK